MRIEDYGFVGDTQTGALVGRDGGVDWLCLPRYDSASCLAALVGDERHGRWRLAPAGEVTAAARRYRPGTLVLETDFETAEGAVRVIDFMPRRADGPPRFMRIVEGLRGRVSMQMELALRPDYGSITPWVEPASDGAIATAGPDAFRLSTPLALEIRDGMVSAEFVVAEGSRERLTLTWHASFEETPPVEDADSALARTEAWWRSWSGRCTYDGPYRDAVLVSLRALKAMTSERTGAIVAAPTTSLPEDLGGVRNWDYRYCWLRDSVLALEALLAGGYLDEALGFRDFMARAGTGDPAKIQIMYGIGGERRLSEFELHELPGYEASKPVRVGNAASEQFQLDVYGEVIGVAYRAADLRGGVDERLWPRWRTIIEYVESIWREPDDGIWESRGPRRHYTYSKVMAWVVFDRAVRLVERFALDAPVERWKQVRDEIHREVCERGYDADRRTFTQYYGSRELDASVLNIPLVGFLPGSDERVTGNDRRGLARAGTRRLRRALLDGGDRRRTARRRRAVLGLLVLAGPRAGAQRPRRRRACPVRAPARPQQRPRPAGRGVRRTAAPAGRQLPAGVQPPDPRRGGLCARGRRGRHRLGRACGTTDGGSTMKTVIVGGVAAGASTGARLRRLDESAEIVVLERDHYVSFANCGLPYHIGGAIPDRQSLLLQTPESLGKSLALDVRTGQDVLRIDRDAKAVEVRDLGEDRTYRESYDKLVLCPGAEPIRPPIPGADDPRVDVLRNIPDMDRIIARLDKQCHERGRRRRQLHRAGAHRGLPGARAADDRRRADRAADAVAGPGDDADPRLPRRHPRCGPAARHVGHGGAPRRRGPARARPLGRLVGRGRCGGDGRRGASQRRARARTPAWRSGRVAASRSTRRCARRTPTSSPPATPSRRRTC